MAYNSTSKRRKVLAPKRKYPRKAASYIPRSPAGWQVADLSKANYSGQEVVMKYAMDYQVTTTIGGPVSYRHFRANSVYDPDLSGVGHQPRGFDQYIPFWNHFTVMSSHMDVKFFSRSASSVPVQTSMMLLGNINSLPPDNASIRETGGALWKNLQTRDGNLTHTSLSRSFDTKKFYRITGDVTNKSQFQGSAAADCVEQAYFTLGIGQHINGPADDVITDVSVTITYRVRFTEAKRIGSS